MKFTDEEIRLCKLIAEKERKEIKYGDWYYYKKAKDFFIYPAKGVYLSKSEIRKKNIFPLWTLSDTIEWLKKREEFINLDIRENITIVSIKVISQMDGNLVEKRIANKSSLEACLKAILVILNGKEIKEDLK